jgi:hypothetical protein
MEGVGKMRSVTTGQLARLHFGGRSAVWRRWEKYGAMRAGRATGQVFGRADVASRVAAAPPVRL